MARTLAAVAALWVGTSQLAPGAASAQNLACPSNPAAASIVQARCVLPSPAPQSGVQATPCKPATNVAMAPSARTVEVSICSKALNRVVSLRVVLPKDYYLASNPPASTLYLFHGANNSSNIISENDYTGWTNNTDVEDVVTYNTNTFVVTPEGGSVGWWSDWRKPARAIINWQMADFPQKWETHFFDEVLPLLAQKFPKQNENRVIAGLSMGGLGAVSFAARAPLHGRFFRAAASFSGALSVKNNYAVVQATLANKLQDANNLWGAPTASDNDWAAHDPRYLVDQLVNLPIWVGTANGVHANGIDPVEAGAWAMSTDYANAQDSAINRARANADAAGTARPKGYVVRDMGTTNPSTGINPGCPGRHEWDNWPIALKRAWPFLKANLTATSSAVPPKPSVPACGDPGYVY